MNKKLKFSKKVQYQKILKGGVCDYKSDSHGCILNTTKTPFAGVNNLEAENESNCKE